MSKSCDGAMPVRHSFMEALEKGQQEKEEKLRETFPALKIAFENYKIVLSEIDGTMNPDDDFYEWQPDNEKDMRSMYPRLGAAWNKYQTVKQLVEK